MASFVNLHNERSDQNSGCIKGLGLEVKHCGEFQSNSTHGTDLESSATVRIVEQPHPAVSPDRRAKQLADRQPR